MLFVKILMAVCMLLLLYGGGLSENGLRTECGMFVMYCMQCCMSVAAVL